jgi:hypothetical protein
MAISKRLRFEILKRDEFRCKYCRNDKTLLTVDHVIPRSLGGSDAPENLVASCDDCNTGKSSTLLNGATLAEPEVDSALDESTLVERVTAEFTSTWGDPHSRPDAECLRILAAHTIAANTAGYDETSIREAAHRGARECVPQLGDILSTVDSVFLLESESSPDNPFGPSGIDRGLLPTQEDRDAQAVADAAVAVWRAAWRDAAEREPGPPVPDHDSGARHAFHFWATDVYRESGDASEVLLGAEWAGATRSENLSAAIDAAIAHRATEPAVSAWGHAWRQATGAQPTTELEVRFWDDLYALRRADVWDHDILTAATYAGAHATTRMHYGLTRAQAQTLGVHAPFQAVEDAWAAVWRWSHGTWPDEDARVALRASLADTAAKQRHTTADVMRAAITAALYESTDLAGGLCVGGSVIVAVAPFSAGGE